MAVWDWIWDNLIHPDLGASLRKKPMAGVTLRDQPGLGMTWRESARPRNRSTNEPSKINRLVGSGRGAARYRNRSTNQPQAPQQDQLGSLYDALLNMLQEPAPSVDEENLLAQIRAAYDPVYDARRQAIEQMMARAQERSATGRSEVLGQYESLGRDYERLAPVAKAQGEEFRQGTEELYGQLRSNIEGNYSRIQEEQADLFKQLGIEAAAPEVLEPQGKSAAEAVASGETMGTLAQQREREVGQLESAYYREGAPLARLQGRNISSQMLADLEDYLQTRESDITTLEAERSAGIQGAFAQMLQQAQGNAQSQQRWQSERLFDLMMAQLDAQNQAPGELTPESYLAMLGPQAQSVTNAYRQIERSPQAISGRQFIGDVLPNYPVPGEVVPITDEWWLNQVDEMLSAGAIDPQTAQLLMNYIRLIQGS